MFALLVAFQKLDYKDGPMGLTLTENGYIQYAHSQLSCVLCSNSHHPLPATTTTTACMSKIVFQNMRHLERFVASCHTM